MEDQAEEYFLSSMKALRQGDRDVFTYSHKVLRLLLRKPSGFQHYDTIMIGYYADGLASQRLRERATLSFRKPNSRETPCQVVLGVMQLATRLKMKGYKKHGIDDTDDDDDDESSATEGSSSDSGSDSDSYYRSSKKRKQPEKSAKSKKSSRKREKRSKSKKGAVTPKGEVVKTRLGNDRIPLDSYNVTDSYERYPQPIRNPYGQRNTGHPNTRRPEYANTESHACYDNVHLKTGRIGPLTSSNVWEPTRQQTNDPRFTQNSSISLGSYSSPCSYEGNPKSQPIMGSDGNLYYPSRELICCYCQELGHRDLQCPRLHDPALRTTLLGPEHPDTPVAMRKKPLAQTQCKPANAVETVVKSSALEEMNVHEVTTTEVSPLDLGGFVREIADDGDGDAEDEERNYEEYEEEEEIIYDVVDDYYPGQVAESPEN